MEWEDFDNRLPFFTDFSHEDYGRLVEKMGAQNHIQGGSLLRETIDEWEFRHGPL